MSWPVLLLARELDLGGSERQMTAVAMALDRSRFEPIVGCFRPDGVRGKELTAAGIGIAHFPVYSFASPSAALGAWKLARFIRRRNIQLVHTFDYSLTVFAVPVARGFTSAMVVSSQRSHRDLIPPHFRGLVRITDRMADRIVVNCEFVRRHLEQDENIPASRIQLCYNGIDLDEFSRRESPRPAALASDALVIGVVGALRPEKDLAVLLDAFARVRQTRGSLKLAVLGSGSESARLESQARTLGISADCVFAPGTHDVASWLRAIDIFVLPSRSEAWSNSLMEAMACGCCALASNIGGNPELVRHGETGLLFESGNAAGLSATLELLIGSDSLRRRLAAAGTQWIRERFSMQSSASRMGEIYSELIEHRRPASA
jgi:L-malate glycosyltransferase